MSRAAAATAAPADRAPRVFAAAVLAIGLAVSAALFTLCWDVLVRPLPYRGQETLVTFWVSDPARDVPRLEINLSDLEAIRRQARSLVAAEASSAANFGVVVHGRGAPVQLQGNLVSNGFYRVLGVEPALGRGFTAAEHRAGAPGAALLSHAAFHRAFGGRAAVLGSKLTIDGEPTEVVGVLPPHVELPAGAEIVFPLEPAMAAFDATGEQRVLAGIGRLAPGTSVERAAAEIAAPIRALEEARPGGLRGLRAAVFPLVGELLGRHREALLLLLAMSGLVLVTAAANASGILLHRGLARRQEVAVRRALGAGPRQLAALFAREALALVSLSLAAGGALAAALLAGFRAIAPAGFPRLAELALGPETALFLAGAALLLAALLGVLPLLAQPRQRTARGGGRAVVEVLRGGAPQVAGDRGTLRALDGLVVVQVALALTLGVGAALAARSYRSLTTIDPGFATGVLTAHVPLGYTFDPEAPGASRQKLRDLLARVERLPGVEAAGSTLMRPLEMEQGWDFTFTAEGQGAAAQDRNPLANLLSVTPGYFAAMGIALRDGRVFLDSDSDEAQDVVVIGESFARRVWGDPARAIGRRLKSGKVDSDKPWLTVVGVVADVRYRGLTTAKPDLYVPFTQSMWSPNYLAVRTARDPAALAPALARAVREVFPDAPLSRPRTTDQLLGAKLAQPRLDALVLATFSLSALLLAQLGIYAVLAYLVRQRRRELGIRLALGAPPRALLLGVLRHSAGLFVAGAALGAAGAWALARLLEGWLQGVAGPPALELAAATAALGLLAVAAAAGPALRAARTDAVVTLE